MKDKLLPAVTIEDVSCSKGEYRATVDHPFHVKKDTLWFRIEGATPAKRVEPALAASLFPAMRQKISIDTSIPACGKFLQGIEQLQGQFSEWLPRLVRIPVNVPVEETLAPAQRKTKRALFFSGGVDAFYSLLALREQLDAIILVFGLDMRSENSPLRENVAAMARKVADSFGLHLVIVDTNVRDFMGRGVTWDYTNGAALAAVAQVLSDDFSEILIASGHWPEETTPWGSHPNTDHLWSSTNLRIIHHAADVTRIDKCIRLKSVPLAMENLRVCWKNPEGAYNCGKCDKCVRTLTDLELAGAAEICRSFPERLDLKLVRTISPKNIADSVWQEESLAYARKSQPGSELTGAMEVAWQTTQDQRLGLRKTAPVRPSLLPDSAFSALFAPLQGRKVHYSRSIGNVGDDLIHEGAEQLFARFRIELVDFDAAEVVVLAGGGNMGNLYAREEGKRALILDACRKKGIPAVLFPQSVSVPMAGLPDGITRGFVREHTSLEMLPGSELAPDTALGIAFYEEILEPVYDVGIWLRTDTEALFADHPSHGDPVRTVPRDLNAYFRQAMRFKRIVTDRLHFAIAGLILGREVVLLPNVYHKTRGMWEAWLKDLGCEWADTPPEISVVTPPLRIPPKASAGPALLPSKKSQPPRIAITACLHNEAEFLPFHLAYHKAIGATGAYFFLDRCTDETASILEGHKSWVRSIPKDAPSPPFHIRDHQIPCMNEALEMARADGFDWLLAIDPDEFAFANNPCPDPPGKWKRMRKPGWFDRNFRPWKNPLLQQASLLTLAASVPENIEQIHLRVRESLSMDTSNGRPFWMNPYFLSKVLLRDMADPATGQSHFVDRFLGHHQGKSLVRTSADVQAYNAHRWTRRQHVTPPFSAEDLAIPTVNAGWHYHFVIISAQQWLKKYRSFGLLFEQWPDGTPVSFPKLEWTRAAATMTPEEAGHYLHDNVFFNESSARRLVDVRRAKKEQSLSKIGQLLKLGK